MPRLASLKDYWADNPPVHMMVKAYLGLGQKAEEEKGDLADLISMLPPTPGTGA